MVLAESLRTDYDFKAGIYRWNEPAEYRDQANHLRRIEHRYPDLRIFSLDYWDPADPAVIGSIYEQQRQNGFEPYVATLALDEIVPEPNK